MSELTFTNSVCNNADSYEHAEFSTMVHAYQDRRCCVRNSVSNQLSVLSWVPQGCCYLVLSYLIFMYLIYRYKDPLSCLQTAKFKLSQKELDTSSEYTNKIN